MNGLIEKELLSIGIELQESRIELLEEYKNLLLKWNKAFNLTAITDEAEIAVKHFADSASVVPKALFPRNANIIDIGTGAGFPGLVLAIIYPEARVTLLDSTNKKISFISTVISELGLDNAVAVCARAEVAAKDRQYREKFDVAVSRAVAQLNVLSELMLGFVKRGGIMIAYKGPNASEEARISKNVISQCGGSLRTILPAGLETLNHSLVVIDKTGTTPSKFPRPYANILKKPII